MRNVWTTVFYTLLDCYQLKAWINRGTVFRESIKIEDSKYLEC